MHNVNWYMLNTRCSFPKLIFSTIQKLKHYNIMQFRFVKSAASFLLTLAPP